MHREQTIKQLKLMLTWADEHKESKGQHARWAAIREAIAILETGGSKGDHFMAVANEMLSPAAFERIKDEARLRAYGPQLC